MMTFESTHSDNYEELYTILSGSLTRCLLETTHTATAPHRNFPTPQLPHTATPPHRNSPTPQLPYTATPGNKTFTIFFLEQKLPLLVIKPMVNGKIGVIRVETSC